MADPMDEGNTVDVEPTQDISSNPFELPKRQGYIAVVVEVEGPTPAGVVPYHPVKHEHSAIGIPLDPLRERPAVDRRVGDAGKDTVSLGGG